MRYTLSTEDLNVKGFKVLTEGISVKKDTNIPVFLNHDPDKVLGKWTNLTIEGNELIGEPVWDTDDEETLKYINKIDKGFIDGVSVGLQFNADDFTLDENNELVLTKSILKEASITPLPANDKARIKETKPVNVSLSLLLVDELNIDELKAELTVHHNSDEKQIKERIEANKEVKVEETKPVIKKKKTSKKEDVKLTDDETTLADRLIRNLNIVIEETDNKYSKVILSIDAIIKEHNDQLIIANEKYATLSAKYDESEKTIETIKQELKTKDIKLFLNKAIDDGKINNDQFNEYLELSVNGNFETVKNIINSQNVNLVNEVKLTDTIKVSNDKTVEKDFEWYQKNDSNYLLSLRKDDIDRYNELLNEYLSNK